MFVYLSDDHFPCREKVCGSIRKETRRSEVVGPLTDGVLAKLWLGGKISTVGFLCSRFVHARGRPSLTSGVAQLMTERGLPPCRQARVTTVISSSSWASTT